MIIRNVIGFEKLYNIIIHKKTSNLFSFVLYFKFEWTIIWIHMIKYVTFNHFQIRIFCFVLLYYSNIKIFKFNKRWFSESSTLQSYDFCYFKNLLKYIFTQYMVNFLSVCQKKKNIMLYAIKKLNYFSIDTFFVHCQLHQ